MLSKIVRVPGFSGRRELPLERLYRYMPLDACNRMVECGEIRVTSSTKTFSRDEDPSTSRQDEEQKKSVRTTVSKIIRSRQVPKGFRFEIKEEGRAAGGTRVKLQSHVDDPYWMLALSTDLTLNLFEEFREKASIEILDPEEFVGRLRDASTQLLVAGDIFDYDHVDYADEYIAYGRAAISVSTFFHKASRYRVQKEYRVVWHPGRIAAKHAYLILGSLVDIVRVVSKEDVENGTRKEMRFPEDAIATYQRTNTPP